jgi:hypothetical protein
MITKNFFVITKVLARAGRERRASLHRSSLRKRRAFTGAFLTA